MFPEKQIENIKLNARSSSLLNIQDVSVPVKDFEQDKEKQISFTWVKDLKKELHFLKYYIVVIKNVSTDKKILFV